jgi:hypothetical protein
MSMHNEDNSSDVVVQSNGQTIIIPQDPGEVGICIGCE